MAVFLCFTNVFEGSSLIISFFGLSFPLGQVRRSREHKGFPLFPTAPEAPPRCAWGMHDLSYTAKRLKKKLAPPGESLLLALPDLYTDFWQSFWRLGNLQARQFFYTDAASFFIRRPNRGSETPQKGGASRAEPVISQCFEGFLQN